MSNDKTKVSGVTYTTADSGYFEKRELKRSGGLWALWGLAIAAVISGDFSGWNFGLDSGGFGGLLAAFVILVLMYYGMMFSIGEMAAAMPHTGGAYSFARAAMGPWGGFITGLAETIEYVATTAVIIYFSAGYTDAITGDLLNFHLPMWAWWIILYAVFIALNAAGSSISFKFALVVAIMSIAILVIFSVMAIFSGKLDWSSLTNITPDAGQSVWLPHGVLGILYAMPFAVWFFLGIEELPLAAEEAHDPVRDIPRAGFWARTTLIVLGLAVLFLNTALTGAEGLKASGEPLLDGFRVIMGNGWAAVLGIFALVGLLASAQGIMFAYGRNMYSLSRAGYYPKVLSLTGKAKTPWVALLVGGIIGFISLVIVDSLGGASSPAGAIVLNIAVWGAMLAYLMQMASFLLLRKKFPNANRPYKSPWGLFGGWIGLIISGLAFVGFLLNKAFLPAIVAIAVVYVVLLAIFALYSRHRLILSPEEEYALNGGLDQDAK